MEHTIKFRNLPFKPKAKQVIYLENEFDNQLNFFFKNRIDDICKIFKDKKLEFVYIPIYFHDDNIEEKIRYYAPYLKNNIIETVEVKTSKLLDYLAPEENKAEIVPCLLYDGTKCGKDWIFKVRPIDDWESFLIIHNLTVFAQHIADSRPSKKPTIKRHVKSDESIVCDSNSGQYILNLSKFTKDEHCAIDLDSAPIPVDEIPTEEDRIKEVIEDLKRNARELRLNGLTMSTIFELIKEEEKLSPIVIKSDYSIVLPDYNNIEIKLTAILKTLYFFFLRYPEGVLLKHLIDHQKELYNIYKQLRPETDERTLRKTIEFLTDPFSNSINEKISQIRKAFVSRFDEHLAKHYTINGHKGSLYKIPIDQNLIIWED